MKWLLAPLFLLALLSQPAWSAQELTTSRRANVQAEKLIDSGDFSEAIELLERAVVKFPKNDRLLGLLCQALYESTQLDRAEQACMAALGINPLNFVAQATIEKIRGTHAASISEQQQVFESVVWDKLGDMVVMALAFFLGIILAGSLRSLNERRLVSRSRRLFIVGQYDEFSDVLEIQLGENNLRPLRQSLRFMLEHKSLEESTEILSQYVNSEGNLSTLKRMIKLSERHRV